MRPPTDLQPTPAPLVWTPALREVQRARGELRYARRRYHAAILNAAARAHTPEQIGQALNTHAHYIANTIRLHRETRCECGA